MDYDNQEGGKTVGEMIKSLELDSMPPLDLSDLIPIDDSATRCYIGRCIQKYVSSFKYVPYAQRKETPNGNLAVMYKVGEEQCIAKEVITWVCLKKYKQRKLPIMNAKIKELYEKVCKSFEINCVKDVRYDRLRSCDEILSLLRERCILLHECMVTNVEENGNVEGTLLTNPDPAQMSLNV